MRAGRAEGGKPGPVVPGVAFELQESLPKEALGLLQESLPKEALGLFRTIEPSSRASSWELCRNRTMVPRTEADKGLFGLMVQPPPHPLPP